MPNPETRSYGTHADQVYDVWRASGPTATTLIYIHGGFWLPEVDRSHATPFVAALAAAGNNVINLEYRRPRNRRWTAMREDLMAGLTSISHEPDLPSASIVIGHSAGGHLAAIAAAQPPVPLVGAITLAGCLDLELASRLNLGQGAVTSMLHGEDAGALAAANPTQQHPTVPVIAIHGTDDRVVPQALSGSYVRSAGDLATYRELRGIDHFSIIDPSAGAVETLGLAIQELMDGRNGPKRSS